MYEWWYLHNVYMDQGDSHWDKKNIAGTEATPK